MSGQNRLATFEEAVLPHLGAAYNLARWLTRNDSDAEDVVQEAYLRAFKFFGGFHGADGRSWLLTIVRNTSYTWLQQNRSPQLSTEFDEEIHTVEEKDLNPEALLLQKADNDLLRGALEELPVEFREVMVLRELEGLEYEEIAQTLDIPVGRVRWRLHTARAQFRELWRDAMQEADHA